MDVLLGAATSAKVIGRREVVNSRMSSQLATYCIAPLESHVA
jgi:hypothetical protein